MKPEWMTADRLHVGTAARVTALFASGPQRERLLGMGVLPGTRILRSSGCPYLFEVQGRSLVLPSRDASMILVHEE